MSKMHELNRRERRFLKSILDRELTMIGRDALLATARAVKYVVAEKIPGDFVECGVWRGGVSMAALHLFNTLDDPREVYLFDTFSGMSEPTKEDTNLGSGKPAAEQYEALKTETHVDWCYASLSEVKGYFEACEQNPGQVKFIEGDVLETLKEPANLPDRISVLRLDTDWFDSTKAELEILYPRLATSGILIVDDYFSWAGSQKAVDAYFDANGGRPFFSRLGNGGVIGAKPPKHPKLP